jgi:hypothetical protein
MMCDTDVEGLIDMSMWIWSGATAPLSISTPSSLQILRISVLARVPISPLSILYRYLVIQHTWRVIENVVCVAFRYSVGITSIILKCSSEDEGNHPPKVRPYIKSREPVARGILLCVLNPSIFLLPLQQRHRDLCLILQCTQYHQTLPPQLLSRDHRAQSLQSP